MMTMSKHTDENGFEKLEMRISEGGSKNITFYGAGVTDIGTVHTMNPKGMGGSDYIRDVNDVARHISDVNATTWLSGTEKEICIGFLREIEYKNKKFLLIKERFDVKFNYLPDSRCSFTFTEKEPKRSAVTITVEQHSSWGESDAWRALYNLLNDSK